MPLLRDNEAQSRPRGFLGCRRTTFWEPECPPECCPRAPKKHRILMIICPGRPRDARRRSQTPQGARREAPRRNFRRPETPRDAPRRDFDYLLRICRDFLTYFLSLFDVILVNFQKVTMSSIHCILQCIIEVRRLKIQSGMQEKSLENVSREKNAKTAHAFVIVSRKWCPKGAQDVAWDAKARPAGTQNGPRDPPKHPKKGPG